MWALSTSGALGELLLADTSTLICHPAFLETKVTTDLTWIGRVTRFVEQLTRSGPVGRALEWRARHKRFEPASFFFGGVMWDAATLRRIDALVDNVILSAYLVVLGVLIVGALLVQAERSSNRHFVKYNDALPAAVQFFMGALFSAYLIFYFQSASLTSTSVFVVLLVGLLIANEFVHRRLFNVYFLVALYYLSAFSFFVFFVPVVTKTMNYLSFLAGGMLGAALVIGLVIYMWRRGVFDRRRQFVCAIGIVALLFAMMNVFYLKNWIPPVPLALRHAGIYHDVSRQGDVYELTRQRAPWYRFWDDDSEFRLAEGDAVYCFAAVFAPTDLRMAIYHEWRQFDEARGEWVTTDRIPYEIEGRRESGYRWYSRKLNVVPGRWMVDIRTANGRTLGRVRFTLEMAPDASSDLETVIYD